ncbi:lipopolysaccharide assembly protein LapB [Streptomyces sp. FH025]|uniref:tetratricopeptide repeat protein n=1 Tax=Streptomyces sp. FH025 TaxID=2815937 RepID=UPI001A9E3E80|nr:hypothetical protein [Streptomyces sp. FH025]MBO1415334.1 hypothetical protein [Streptomyces sp. FH025]
MGKPDLDRAEEARDLEEAAERTRGEDRLSFLSQAADHWSEAGAYDRAIDLLTRVAAESGDPADAGSPVLACSLFRAGREEEAWEVVEKAEGLAAAGQNWRDYDELADYLVRADRPERALKCYDEALRIVLGLEQPDAPEPEHPALRPLSSVRRNRMLVRQRLGLPADEHDKAAVKALPVAERWRRRRRP